jgi:hypothetical protein
MPTAPDPARSVLVLVDYPRRLMPAVHDGERVAAGAFEAVLQALKAPRA